MAFEVVPSQRGNCACFQPVRAAAAAIINTVLHMHKSNALGLCIRVRGGEGYEPVVVEEVIRELDQPFVTTSVMPAKVHFLEYRDHCNAIIQEGLQWDLPGFARSEERR